MKLRVAYRLTDDPKASIMILDIKDNIIDGTDFDENIEIDIVVMTFLMAKLKLEEDDLEKLEFSWEKI